MNEVKSVELPIPYYPSRRLVGLEVELDASTAAFHKPELPPGWQSKPDMSLKNGQEYVLEPAMPCVEAKVAVEAFSAAVTKSKMHVAKAGGFHLHVQVHDYSNADAERLCQIYWRFQECIDLLVGPSRRTKPTPNSNCTPFTTKPTIEYLIEIFQLAHEATTRAAAKESRQKLVINLAMMRCRDALHRSVEFRQPSPSKHAVNLYGWTCFLVGLVEIAKDERIVRRFVKAPGSWRHFLALCRRIERKSGATNIVAWVKWRRDYLNTLPPSEKFQALYRCLVGKPRGVFYIARKLNLNLTVTRKMIDAEIAKGSIVEEQPLKYRTIYEACAPMDLKHIIRIWQSQEHPAQVTATPPTRTASSTPAV